MDLLDTNDYQEQDSINEGYPGIAHDLETAKNEIARLQVELNNAVQFARFVNEDRDKLRVQKAALVAALENQPKRGGLWKN
jgi:hypothetical protein